MGVTILTKEEAIKLVPDQIEWLEDNNIQYTVYEEWISSTGEYGFWISIKNEQELMAFKLRWL